MGMGGRGRGLDTVMSAGLASKGDKRVLGGGGGGGTVLSSRLACKGIGRAAIPRMCMLEGGSRAAGGGGGARGTLSCQQGWTARQ